MLDVPAVAVDDDFLERLLARQNRRQHDAVVVHARFGVEDGDLVAVGRGFQQVLEHSPGRHAVADDDEFLGHDVDVLGIIRPARRRRWSANARSLLHRRTAKCIHSEAGGDDREKQHEAARPDAGEIVERAEGDRQDEAAEAADHADEAADRADVLRVVDRNVLVDRGLAEAHEEAEHEGNRDEGDRPDLEVEIDRTVDAAHRHSRPAAATAPRRRQPKPRRSSKGRCGRRCGRTARRHRHGRSRPGWSTPRRSCRRSRCRSRRRRSGSAAARAPAPRTRRRRRSSRGRSARRECPSAARTRSRSCAAVGAVDAALADDRIVLGRRTRRRRP